MWRTDDQAKEDVVMLPRKAVRFPIELRPPPGFHPDDHSSWPQVEGRIEYVGGRIEYMPPCADVQQALVPEVAWVLTGWTHEHPEFTVSSNEAGMKLGGDVRGADAAIWRIADLGPASRGMRRVPPVLAVEVGGEEEDEAQLRDKARWYLAHGVEVVWLILPESREVLVFDAGGIETRHRRGEQLREHASLPGLAPGVDGFFVQLDRRS